MGQANKGTSTRTCVRIKCCTQFLHSNSYTGMNKNNYLIAQHGHNAGNGIEQNVCCNASSLLWYPQHCCIVGRVKSWLICKQNVIKRLKFQYHKIQNHNFIFRQKGQESFIFTQLNNTDCINVNLLTFGQFLLKWAN